MQFEVTVQLKKEVLDPEGRAIQETIARLGEARLHKVTVAKKYVLEIDDAPSQARLLADQIAKEYLANPVSETYEVRPL